MITLNLLPLNNKIWIARRKTFLILKEIMILIIIFVIIYFAILFLTKMYLNDKLSNVNDQISTLQKSMPSDITASTEQLINDLNRKIKYTDDLQKKYYKFSNIILNITQLIPGGVNLTELSITDETKNVLIRGKAATRDNLIQYKNNLTDSIYFASINLPQQYLTSREGIDFEITGVLNTENIISKNE